MLKALLLFLHLTVAANYFYKFAQFRELRCQFFAVNYRQSKLYHGIRLPM